MVYSFVSKQRLNTPIPGFGFPCKNQSFLVTNLLNNQSDFLKFRSNFVQDNLNLRRFLKMVKKTPNWCIDNNTSSDLFNNRF